MHNDKYPMKYTDNPYVDILVNSLKNISIGCVIKDEDLAYSKETLESRTQSNDYMAYKSGRDIDGYDEFNYIELNNYYRRMMGLPDLPSDQEIKAFYDAHGNASDITPLYEKYYIYLEEYQDMIPETSGIIISDRCIHDYSSDSYSVAVLENLGVISKIKEKYTGKGYEYLDFMGDKYISSYTARKAENFSLLYIPNTKFEDIYHKFISTYDRNRSYTLATIYSDAYKYGNTHYNDFIKILIILQTMVDMISEVQEYIINKEIFDSRTIRYLFESYGIDYYKEIPNRYQVAMIKNIHNLLKFKSSNKNIVDICTLFGFPNMQIFTYYLLKTKTKNKENLEFYTQEEVGLLKKPDGSYVGLEDVGREKYTNYDLKFIRVPLESSNVSEYINKDINLRSYDYITKQDPFWDGISDSDILSPQERENYHNQKKNEILAREFSYERTKYISIDSAINITKLSYQVTYFMNMLYDKHADEELLKVAIDSRISTNKVKLNDLLLFGIGLSYLYNDINPDIVITDTESNMMINGFNFDSDWTTIYNLLSDANKKLVELTTVSPGAYLSGRYTESKIWQDAKEYTVFDSYEGYDNYFDPCYRLLDFNVLNQIPDGGNVTPYYCLSCSKRNYCNHSMTNSYPSYLHHIISTQEYSTSYMHTEYCKSHIIDIAKEDATNTEADFINTNILLGLFGTNPDTGMEYTDDERMNKLKDIYYTNTKLYDHLKYMMKNAQNKKEYDIYKTIFDSFMYTEVNREFYGIKDGNGNYIYVSKINDNDVYYLTRDSSDLYDVYSNNNGTSILAIEVNGVFVPDTNELKIKIAKDLFEFLLYRNVELSSLLSECSVISNLEDRKIRISELCDYIGYSLERYFDSDEWRAIFNVLPTRNVEFIQQCIIKVVLFFKSWKTHMLNRSVEYVFDDDFDNYFQILDDMTHKSKIGTHEKYSIDNSIGSMINQKVFDTMDIIDKVEFNITEEYHAYQTTELDFIYWIDPVENVVYLIRYLTRGYPDIVLPVTIEGVTVKYIEATCFTSTDVVNVDIPDNITVIGG